MKLIVAIIRETKLDEVREELINNNIQGLTVVRVSGHGKQISTEYFRGKKIIPALIPKVKLEIVVQDEIVDKVIDIIIKSARTNNKGEIGDGKIWILNIENCIRIRTGETGISAI